jgi:hypothetical protein
MAIKNLVMFKRIIFAGKMRTGGQADRNDEIR